MGQFVAKLGHDAICCDILNIMKIVMMVAGNCNVENKFREGKGSLLDFGTHTAGFGESHAVFFNFVAHFSIRVDI